MKDRLLLVVAVVLIGFAILKPDLSNVLVKPKPGPSDDTVVSVVTDISPELKIVVAPVIESLKNGPSDRKADAKRLANLFYDMSTLVELDGDQSVIKNTDDLREANSLIGAMLRMNIKGKYPDLSANCNKVVVASIGEDSVALDSDLRKKAVDAFRALSWACNEGGK